MGVGEQMTLLIAGVAALWASLKWRELIARDRKEAEETMRREIEANERLDSFKVIAAERIEIIKALTEGAIGRSKIDSGDE